MVINKSLFILLKSVNVINYIEIISLIVEILVLGLTCYQIRLNNKHALFDKRIECLLLTQLVYHSCLTVKNFKIDKNNFYVAIDSLYIELTNNNYFFDIRDSICDVTNNKNRFDFYKTIKKIEYENERINFLYSNNVEKKYIYKLLKVYVDLIKELFAYKTIVIRLNNKDNDFNKHLLSIDHLHNCLKLIDEIKNFDFGKLENIIKRMENSTIIIK